jgi:hypothetical protein
MEIQRINKQYSQLSLIYLLWVAKISKDLFLLNFNL